MEKEISKLFDSSGNRQTISINIFKGLNSSFSLFKQDSVSLWYDFLRFFLSPMRLLVHTAYSVCYSTTVLYMYSTNVLHFISASAKDCAKNNKN